MSEQHVTLSHGAGGAAMQQFIQRMFVERFGSPELLALTDAACLELPASRIAFTTDSYVVKPLEFPGGSIGKLAVCGTVNDLAVMGAQPVYLAAGFILEEGLPLALLERVVADMIATAAAANVAIVTGDTKVVPRGECDGLFINTTGIGVFPHGNPLNEQPIADGDAILISGTVGDHGIAILSAREGLKFDSHVVSDCAPLAGMIGGVLAATSGVKWMRDPTRGGLAAVLSELTAEQPFGALIRDTDVPVRDDVQSICELLGFDPVHLANEGKVVMVVTADAADAVLNCMRKHPLGTRAARIGTITAAGAGGVRVETVVGGIRRLQRPAGELLPRIC